MYLEIQGLLSQFKDFSKALCKFKDFSRQPVKFKGFSRQAVKFKDFSVTIQGLFKALCKFKDFSRQPVTFKGFSRQAVKFKDFSRQAGKFKGFSILYKPWVLSLSIRVVECHFHDQKWFLLTDICLTLCCLLVLPTTGVINILKKYIDNIKYPYNYAITILN